MKSLARSKFTQCKIAKDALFECWEHRWEIVEAVPTNGHSEWGSGLSKEATLHTRKSAWPGDNRMGQILTELSYELFGHHKDDDGDWESDESEQGAQGYYGYGEGVEPNDPSAGQDPTTFTKSMPWNFGPPPIGGRGGPRGRGGRGRSGSHHARSRSQQKPAYNRRPSPRSESRKRKNSNDVQNKGKMQRQQPMIVKSKFADGSFKVK